MALVTPLRRLLSHYGYLSVEMMNAINNDKEDELPEDDRDNTVMEKGNKTEIRAEDIDYEELTNQQVSKEAGASVPAGPSY